MHRIRSTMFGMALIIPGILAFACTAAEPPREPARTAPEIVLNDLTYEADLAATVSHLDRRVRATLAELDLEITRAIGSVPDGTRHYRAGNGERIVDIELAMQDPGATTIRVSAVRVIPLRGAEVVEDSPYARLVLQRIIGQR